MYGDVTEGTDQNHFIQQVIGPLVSTEGSKTKLGRYSVFHPYHIGVVQFWVAGPVEGRSAQTVRWLVLQVG